MALFTLHQVARLHKAFSIMMFLAFLYLVGLKAFKAKIECNLGEKVNERCLNSSYYTYFDRWSMETYDKNNKFLSFYLLFWAIGFYGLWKLWSYWRTTRICLKNYPQLGPKETGFNLPATLFYLSTCTVCLVVEKYTLNYLLDYPIDNFGAIWWMCFSAGIPDYTRHVDCIIRYERALFAPEFSSSFYIDKPVKKPCYLTMNARFELVYLVLWFWFWVLLVVNILCLLRCILFACSSTLRFDRLSTILKGVDQQRIFILAQEVNLFFRLESCAGGSEKLKGQRLLDFAVSASDSSFKPAVIKTKHRTTHQKPTIAV